MTASAQAVKNLFPLFDVPALEPRYNVAPTQQVLAVRAGPELVRLRWGLIPAWADDPSMGNRLLNARSETVAEKPAFRSAFRKRRCLVLADGFYEWQKTTGSRQPYYFRLRDEKVFAFAGLWEHWERDGEEVESCTILTTSANELLRSVHDRMPVILPRAEYDQWLDPTVKELPKLQALLRPYPADAMTSLMVDKHVNNARNDDPLCIAAKA